MSIEHIQSELDTILRADAGVAAWLASTAPGKTWATVKNNRPVGRIQGQDIPGIGYEPLPEPAELEREASDRTTVTFTLAVYFIWHEDDHASSFDQRLTLHEPFIQALMANGTLNDKADEVYVTGIQGDGNAHHPKHILRFDVTGIFQIAPA